MARDSEWLHHDMRGAQAHSRPSAIEMVQAPSICLAEHFLANLPSVKRTAFESIPNLEGLLAALVTKGQLAWPNLALTAEDFVAFLGHSLSVDVVGQLDALHSNDLWLVCAFAIEIPGAADAFHKYTFRYLAQTLRQLGAHDESIADIMQELCRCLVEMREPRPDQRGYEGRGRLLGWLRIAAIRMLNRQRARVSRELSLDGGPILTAPSDWEPEFCLLMKTHKRELTTAFQQALGSMSSRERNILRYYFIEELTIDRIALVYSVHRATAARWVNQARDVLFMQTRTLFRERVSMSDAEFHRVLILLESQIQQHLVEASARDALGE